MNKLAYRLVFSRRLGMRVAVAETARAAGPAASTRRGRARRSHQVVALGLALIAAGAAQAQSRTPVGFASQQPKPTQNLPVALPNTTSVGSAQSGNWVSYSSSGSVPTLSSSGKTLTINQGTANQVILNWSSFNIGAGYTVQFVQNPNTAVYVSALNRIWDANPSLIFGSLQANREVILVNANGVYFGAGATVDTGELVASSLSIADSVFKTGLRNITDGSAAFSTLGTDFQATNLNSAVTVEAGAEISSAAGGDVILVAPRVVNQGSINTPQGQTILAAGGTVYLASSADPTQRGLIVAVDPVLGANGNPDPTLGTVENDANGSTAGLVNKINAINAASGTVNLVGLAVNQNGVINATTAVAGANGAIYLEAMSSTELLGTTASGGDTPATRGIATEAGTAARFGATLGTVSFGPGSVTQVQPDGSSATQLDAATFTPSLIHVEGSQINVGAGASILAPSGNINLLASQTAVGNLLFDSDSSFSALPAADSSQILISPQATISAAGLASVAVDGSRYQGSIGLFQIELADSPVQRSGPLYRDTVYFDLNDASSISIANVTGAANSIARTAAEHSTAGGTVSLQSTGSVVTGAGSTLDVSGGSIAVSQATIQTTEVVQNGRVVSLDNALASQPVTSVLATTEQTVVPAYTLGANGGSLLINAPQISLAGNLKGTVSESLQQRDGSFAAPVPASLTLGADYNQGSYSIDSLVLDGSAAGAVNLSLASVAAGGFGSLNLFANQVSEAGQGVLDLGPAGSLSIQAVTIALDGVFTAPGGSISLQTPPNDVSSNPDTVNGGQITLSSATRLSTAGLWTNDSAGVTGSAVAPVEVKGGSINVSAAGSLLIGPGAQFDVSAGAWLAGSGALTKGKAGSIDLAVDSNLPVTPQMTLDGVAFSAYDFGSGGSISLSVPSLAVANQAQSTLTLAPSWFGSSGAGSIAVTTYYGDIDFVSGATLAPQLLNWQWSAGYRSAPSGAMSAAVATPAVTNPLLATPEPVKLSFDSALTSDTGGSISNLVVERGASITLVPGSSLSLSAAGSIDIGDAGGSPAEDSVLSVPGGTISLSIGPSSLRDLDHIDSEAIWLGSGAQLNVSGVAELRPASTPLAGSPASASAYAGSAQQMVGTVLGGGTIDLNAASGYVVAATGSSLRLDGAAAAVSYAGVTNPVVTAQPAGTLNISTQAGFAIDATISAKAPQDAGGHALADGGTLTISLSGGGLDTLNTAYTGPRIIEVGNFAGLIQASGAAFGLDLSAPLGSGIGYLNASMLQQTGFANVALAAGDQILFNVALNLNVPLGIQLNAPAIAAAPGVQVDLTTSYAQIGDAYAGHTGPADTSAVADTSVAGTTSLTINAPTIDVYGNFGFQGFSTVNLNAGSSPSGQIRFSSYTPAFSSPSTLNFAGDLNLSAGQIYATTATHYVIDGLASTGPGDPGSQIVISPAAGGVPAALPLSAFGALTINATTITQNGVIRQPFGQITLDAAQTLTLGPGSVTSVSGDGASVLDGTTLNLADWETVYAGAATKGISLSANQIVTSPTAVVDAAGGGNLLAWEFIPGVGGSSDYFLNSGLYAVLPDYGSSGSVALDGGILAGNAAAQQIVITMAGSGLAPGRYTLLPARDALLAGDLPQGAYLVSLAPSQGSTVLAAPIAQPDGSTIVTGYLSSAGSVDTGVPGQRFVVEPYSTFSAKSEIALTDVSSLLASQASLAGQPTPTLPHDGGSIQILDTGTTSSVWQAQIELGAAGGTAGWLDVSATNLALVANAADSPANSLAIDAAVLNTSGAGSTLLGGLRTLDTSASTPTWDIDSSATQSVSVNLGSTTLSVEELLLAAAGSVTLAPGTTVNASLAPTLGARTLALGSSGALVAVSADGLSVERSNAVLGAGNLTIGAGSALSGNQVVLDATGNLQVDPAAALNAGSVSVGAPTIVVGGPATSASALSLAGGLLASVEASSSVDLRAYTNIDFVGTQNWSGRPAATAADPDPAPPQVLTSLVLDAPVIRGVAAGDGTPAATDIAAQQVTLQNTSGVEPDPSLSGSGSLTLQALPALSAVSTGGLTLGPGDVALGFASVTLRSAGDLIASGTGSTTAQGDLTLSAARVTAANAAAQTVTAAGALTIATEAASHTLGELVGAGASLTLAGNTVAQDGVVQLPGGLLSIDSTGVDANGYGVVFGAGSITSAGGFAVTGANGRVAYGGAGSISVNAAQGAIEVLGTVDVSAARNSDGSAGQGSAGSLSFSADGSGGSLVLAGTTSGGSAVHGQLLGLVGSASTDLGASLSVDVTALAAADDLAATAQAGGFSDQFNLRVRSGDLSLNQGITAQQITVSADAGALSIGTASSTPVLLNAAAPAGGVVQLAAGGNLNLGSAARIDAASSNASANGGDVLVASVAGVVDIDPNAVINAGSASAQDGRIVLSALRSGSSVAMDPINPANLLAGEVDVEALKVYKTVTVGSRTVAIDAIGSGSSSIVSGGGVLGQTSVENDSLAYMATASLASLGVNTALDPNVHLMAGVEVDAPGNLTLNSAWLLNTDRPGGEAGFLTLRAAGNLVINASINDGFTSAATSAAYNGDSQSWSYRLVGGADLSAANALAVVNHGSATTAVGDVELAASTLVRTGAGSIAIAAGEDILFNAAAHGANPASIYVAGEPLSAAAGPQDPTLFAQATVQPSFTGIGGSVVLQAERDIIATEPVQLVNNWLWRSGTASTDPNLAGQYDPSGQLAWWTQVAQFDQSVGSFGGGNISVSAGRNIVDLQVMAPSAGWATSATIATAAIDVVDGGNVTVSAGNNVLGGQFFVGQGQGRITAGGEVGADASNVRAKDPVLAMMDGTWDVTARASVTLGGDFDPTYVSPPTANNRVNQSPIFATWSRDAGVTAIADSGSISFNNELTASAYGGYGLYASGQSGTAASYFFDVTSPNLSLVAPEGNVNLFATGSDTAAMFPSATGELSLWAGGNINIKGELWMVDVAPSSLANVNAPQPFGITANDTTHLEDGLAINPVIPSLAGIHAADSNPVSIYAGASIDQISSGSGEFILPKASDIYAGLDISGLQLLVENLSSSDVTTITAGRNFSGGIDGSIEVAGPGSLVLSAGQQIDLGSSAGVFTSGNERSAVLPAQGASITMIAAASGTLSLEALQSEYLDPSSGNPLSSTYQQMLVTYVDNAYKLSGLSFDQAWARFQQLPAAAQAAFGQQVLTQQFVATYLTDTPPTAAQMNAELEAAFDQSKAQILAAGQAALAAGQALVLPGQDSLSGSALSAYLAKLGGLSYADLDMTSTIAARVAQLAALQTGWDSAVAQSLGTTTAALATLAQTDPQSPLLQHYQAALTNFSGPLFNGYRQQVFESEIANTGAAAANFGVLSLPMRIALYNQGFEAAELSGCGSFVAQPIWPGSTPLLSFDGNIAMTQSTVETLRGGAISLIDAGGEISVGFKPSSGGLYVAQGVIALGGGDVFGYAQGDFQVNNQRVLTVGDSSMTIWSSDGNIDSGRGANTAVAAPPLVAQPGADGVVFVQAATTTGSGLGILPNIDGVANGTIGLFPAFGEILALDAYIRAPSVILGGTVVGTGTVLSGNVSGSGAQVAAPALSVSAAPSTASENHAADSTANSVGATRDPNSLLTVEFEGFGTGSDDSACSADDQRQGKCKRPAAACGEADKAAGHCS